MIILSKTQKVGPHSSPFFVEKVPSSLSPNVSLSSHHHCLSITHYHHPVVSQSNHQIVKTQSMEREEENRLLAPPLYLPMMINLMGSLIAIAQHILMIK